MQKKTGNKIVNITFAIALTIFVLIGWLAYQNMAAMRKSEFWVAHTHLVLDELDTLLYRLTAAETGERGYIITGDAGFLEPYNNAIDKIETTQRTLEILTKDNPRQLKLLNNINPIVDQKIDELKTTLEINKTDGYGAARLVVQSHLGKNLMSDIRKYIREASTIEQNLLEERTRRQQEQSIRTVQVVTAGGAICLLLLVTVYLLLKREIGNRLRSEMELTAQKEKLQQARKRQESVAWVKIGLNELNTRVRGDRQLRDMAGEAIAFVSTYLKIGVSALYLFEEQTKTLRRLASYALTPGGSSRETILLGEGIAGEAAIERRHLSLKSIPPDYLKIGSALGEAEPRTIQAFPLLYDNRLIGVIELGAFEDFSESQLDFLKQAAEILAIAINVSETRQRINDLLQQSQSQEEELRVQQEELQQTNEELEERTKLLLEQRQQIHLKNEELESASIEINRKAAEMEQISAYKSEFLANMSHELRTPLNSLMILSSHLMENKENNLTAKQVEYAATIKSAGRELLNLINDILDLSRIEAGRLDFVYDDTTLAVLCEQLEEMFTPVARQKELKFTTGIEEGMAEKIPLDRQRTLQVLKNLIANGLKFTSDGSVTLHIRGAKKDENPLSVPAVAFVVSDSGIGIPADKHEVIFQAFRQADGSVSRRFGGTGLGLSISRQLARGMGGEILVSSEENVGSVFTLYLPVAAATAGESPAAKSMGSESLRDMLQPVQIRPLEIEPLQDDRHQLAAGDRSILIIEDDLTFAGVLMEKVRARGFAALVATDGGNGIELAEKYLPTAILLDALLPGIDGWGVMQKITENLDIRHIPVHFITCLEERQKALSMGAIGFVTKPVTVEQLDDIFEAIEYAVARTVKKLLIVEDDTMHASALVALLEERDIAISVARSGAQAIELLTDDSFDCIVLDLGLADISGFTLLDHIRSLDQSRRIPVIVHTGKELSALETQRLQHYAESIIIKGAKSPERLLNEVTLFLHVMESRLSPDKQQMIRNTLDVEKNLSGKKILMVDDDMRNIFSLSSVLADKGMQIVEAENGRVALMRLEEHPDVDLVLMDVMMPEMDGLEATRLIRKDPRFTRLPIITLTAKAMKSDRQACLEAGASDYITKPVEMDQLLSLLRVWLYRES